MSSLWYEIVGAEELLTQGDIVLRCPLLTWTPTPAPDDPNYSAKSLDAMASVFQDDVIVVTQACDLENDKVKNVVLCPHVSLTRFRDVWQQAMNTRISATYLQYRAVSWKGCCAIAGNGEYACFLHIGNIFHKHSHDSSCASACRNRWICSSIKETNCKLYCVW